jgi:hypothetical protein
MGRRLFYPLIRGDWGDYLGHCYKNEVSIETINTLEVVVIEWIEQAAI